MIFQEPMTSLNPAYSVGEQIAEVVRLHEGMAAARPRSSARSRCWRWCASRIRSAGCNDYPHQFSGGMRQRVMIAMALSCNPAC
jgi:ABC-type dipeptide/oligopeptide/nickel transport system ATPase component